MRMNLTNPYVYNYPKKNDHENLSNITKITETSFTLLSYYYSQQHFCFHISREQALGEITS